jgi:hypothetical protein
MQESFHARERRHERRVPLYAIDAARTIGRRWRVSDADHYLLRRKDLLRVPSDLRRRLAPWTGLIVIMKGDTTVTQFTNPRPVRYLDRKRLRTSLRSKRGTAPRR